MNTDELDWSGTPSRYDREREKDQTREEKDKADAEPADMGAVVAFYNALTRAQGGLGRKQS